MEYTPLLKQAWQITWKHKGIWVLSFFATGAFFYLSYMIPQERVDEAFIDPGAAFAGVRDDLALIALVAVFGLLILLVLKIVSVAAYGGIVQMTNDAAAGTAVSIRGGWAAGFQNWFRILFVCLLGWAPSFIVGAVIVGLAAVPLLAMPEAGLEAAGTGLMMFCGVIVIGLPIAFVIGIVSDLLVTLGLRHAIIGGRPALESLGAAFADSRKRFKEVISMWFLLFAIIIVGSIALAIPSVAFGIFDLIAAEIGPLLQIPLGFLEFLVTAAYMMVWWTFHSAAWTLLYRRLRDDESVAAAPQGIIDPPMPVTSVAAAEEPSFQPAPSSQYVIAPYDKND